MSDCTGVYCCTKDFSTGGGCGKVTNQILGRGSVATLLKRHLLAENDVKGPGDPIRRWRVIPTEKKKRSAPTVVRLSGME